MAVKDQIATIVLRFIDQFSQPMQRASRTAQQHSNIITSEFKKMERGVGTFIGAFAGIGTITREMSRLNETMMAFSKTQQQIMAMDVKFRYGQQGDVSFIGAVGSRRYRNERNKYTETALRISKEINTSPESVLEEIRALRSYGMSPETARRAAGPMIQLAQITGETDYLGLSKKVFGAATEFGMGLGLSKVEQTSKRMASQLAYMQTKNVTPQQFLESSLMAGTAAAQAGMTIEDFSAILGGLAERQITGSQAGVQLRSDIVRLQNMKVSDKPGSAYMIMKKYGGIEKYVTQRDVTPERLLQALQNQFTLEAGGVLPTMDELQRAAAIADPAKRERLIRNMAQGMAPGEYAKEMRTSPETLTKQIDLANITRGLDINMIGKYNKQGQYVPGLIDALVNDPQAYGIIFEGRQLSRNEALAASRAMREMVRRAKVPPELAAKEAEAALDTDSWFGAFTHLSNAIQRAFVRFGKSSVGQRIIKWINQIADWIDQISESFGKMSGAEQKNTFWASAYAFLVGLSQLMKAVGQFMSGNLMGAVTTVGNIGLAAAATYKTYQLTGDPAKALAVGGTAALAGSWLQDLIGNLVNNAVPMGIGALLANLLRGGIGPLLRGAMGFVARASPWALGAYALGEGAKWMTGRDNLLDAGIDIVGSSVQAWQKLFGSGYGRSDPTHIMGPGKFPTGRFTESDDSLSSRFFGMFGASMPWSSKNLPGYMPPVAGFDQQSALEAPNNLADIADNTAHLAAYNGEWPKVLHDAFLQSLNDWSAGQSGAGSNLLGSLGGGFGFGAGGSGGGGGGTGGIGASFITGDPLIDSLFKGEGTGGNWSAVLGHGGGIGVDLTKMTLRQVLALGAQIKMRSHARAGPMGAFQIVGATLRAHAARLGMDLDKTLFSPENQIKLFRHILATEGPGAWAGFHGRRFSREQILHALKYDWSKGLMSDSGGASVGGGDYGLFGSHGGVSALGAGGLNPTFAAKLNQLHEMAAKEGIHFRIQPGEGYRSFEEQARIYASHHPRGLPGARPGGSYHNYGRAGDLEREGGGSLPMSEKIRLGAMAESIGLTWGGRFRDPAHFQLGPAGGAGWIMRKIREHPQQEAKATRLDVHIHDDGVRMKAKGNMPIRANYRGKRMADVGSGTHLGIGSQWWNN